MAKVLTLYSVHLDCPDEKVTCLVVAPTMRKAILIACSECNRDVFEVVQCNLLSEVMCDCK